MAVTSNLGFNVRQNLPQIGGGVVGVAGPAALRETADVQMGPLVGSQGSTLARVSHPSVVWGVGAGAATGALWALDVGPSHLQDFYLAHSITAIPTGLLSALLPKGSAGGGGDPASQITGGIQRAMTDASPSGNGTGEFADAGGSSPETQPAN